MADLRLDAWFLWITPLLTALSSFLDAARSASFAASLSPEAAASRKERTLVFSADLTDLLRKRRFSLVAFRLIWDLMFAKRRLSVREPAGCRQVGRGLSPPGTSGGGGAGWRRGRMRARPGAHRRQGYQAGTTVLACARLPRTGDGRDDRRDTAHP